MNAVWLGAAAVALSCTSDPVPPTTPRGDLPEPPGNLPQPSGNSPQPTGNFRQLTLDQHDNAVRALIGRGVDTPMPDGWHSVLQGAVGGVSAQLAEQYELAALNASGIAFADAELRMAVVRCEPSAQCNRSFLQAFTRKAWRRPVLPEEVTRYATLASKATEVLGNPWEGLGMAVAGVLQSPHFLYQTPLAPPREVEGRMLVSSLDMASRLAFFLWNSIPDDELLTAGEHGLLADPAHVRKQVTRMLAMPQARAGVMQVFADLLNLHYLPSLKKDAAFFPAFDKELAHAMHEEILLTLSQKIFDERGDYRDLFTLRDTRLNRQLAILYGVEPPAVQALSDTSFFAARWPESQPRAGLLGFAGVLALQATPRDASPSLRGKYVRETFLCQEIPPPPEDVSTILPPVDEGEITTTRARLMEHNTNPSCAACHQLMDPIGLALHTFDAVGAFRAKENGLVIDASGTLDGIVFQDAAGLGQALHDHPDVPTCLVRQLVRYAAGRLDTNADEDMVAAFTEAFAARRFDVMSLMEIIATSRWFEEVWGS